LFARAKPTFFFALHEFHPGKFLRQHFATAVIRGAVHHYDLKLNTARVRVNGLRALPHVILGIPIDDDDGQFWRWLHKQPLGKIK